MARFPCRTRYNVELILVTSSIDGRTDRESNCARRRTDGFLGDFPYPWLRASSARVAHVPLAARIGCARGPRTPGCAHRLRAWPTYPWLRASAARAAHVPLAAKNRFIGIFRSKKLQLFLGPWTWVGLWGGPAGAAHVRAPMRGTWKHPKRLLPVGPPYIALSQYFCLKSLFKIMIANPPVIKFAGGIGVKTVGSC